MVQGGHGGVPVEDHVFGLLEGLVVDLRRPKAVPPVDQMDLLGHAAQQQGVGGSGIAAAHHGHGLAPVEHAVTGRAVVDAPAQPGLLVRHAQGAGVGSGGQEDRPAPEVAVGGMGYLNLAGQVQGQDLAELGLRAEALGLGLHLLAQGEAVDALVEAGVVVHLLGQRNLAAGGELLQHHGGETRPGAVEGGGVSGGAAADNQYIIELVHGRNLLRSDGARGTRQWRLWNPGPPWYPAGRRPGRAGRWAPAPRPGRRPAPDSRPC